MAISETTPKWEKQEKFHAAVFFSAAEKSVTVQTNKETKAQ